MGHLREELKEKLPYGNVIMFNKADGLWRFRCSETGLWKHYMTMLDKDGNPKKGWGSNGEVIGEGFDMHFVASNGQKIFMFPKKEKKK